MRLSGWERTLSREVGTLPETDTGQIDHTDVAGAGSRGACGQTARRLVGYALFVRKCAHGDRHAAPQVQAERHAPPPIAVQIASSASNDGSVSSPTTTDVAPRASA